MTCKCSEFETEEKNVSRRCFWDLWLFDDLEEHEQALFNAIALRKEFRPGQAVFMQGDSAAEMFLIKAGRIKLTKILEHGAEVTLDFRRAGDILGENMLAEEVAYPVSAWSLEKTFVCGFNKEGFNKLILQHPRIGLRIIQNMSKRLASLTSRLSHMTTGSLEERIYSMLVNIARDHSLNNPKGLVLPFPLTHEELSFLVGAHRVSITRAMKTLVDSGKIIKEGRTIILPEPKM